MHILTYNKSSYLHFHLIGLAVVPEKKYEKVRKALEDFVGDVESDEFANILTYLRRYFFVICG